MALLVFLIAMMVVPAFAVDHIVGDNKGWNTDVDYTVWAEGQDFHVGDSIIFMYARQDDNVIKVNATEFEHCTYSNTTDKIWKSGFDVVPLASPEKHWYISGMLDNCSKGMKLVVSVSVAQGPAPAPMPGSSAPPPSTSTAGEVLPSPRISCLWVLAVMAAYRMIMVLIYVSFIVLI